MWREYHEATKHTVEALRRSTHRLDWANQPDPFRHYEGVPLLDLPADPRVLDTGAAFLSQLLYHSAAISASKVVPSTGEKYALRVNPSSGNLHPTEFHFITRGLVDWPDGLYHYRPSSHMAEQRAVGNFEAKPPITFILTSIAWREAWKYQNRAYRYCLHDIGHAGESLAIAAREMGCDAIANGEFADDEVAAFCRFEPDEWPMLIVEITGNSIPTRNVETTDRVWFGGVANRLSRTTVPYPLIDSMHAATKRTAPGNYETNPTPDCGLSLAQFARTRRSALDFRGGDLSITRDQLSRILECAGQTHFIELYLYVHRVDGLQPGVYRGDLELVRSGDQRVAAAGLSLGQDLAGNACVAFSMIGDLERATRKYGDRGYRYVHFEAGAMGQRMYLAAEALGLGATGIGAFFDDRVHQYLEIKPDEGQVIYHFAIGYPVVDNRIRA